MRTQVRNVKIKKEKRKTSYGNKDKLEAKKKTKIRDIIENVVKK